MTNDNEPECEKCGSTMTDTGEVFVCDDRSCGWNMEKYTNADGNIKSCPKCGNPNECTGVANVKITEKSERA